MSRPRFLLERDPLGCSCLLNSHGLPSNLVGLGLFVRSGKAFKAVLRNMEASWMFESLLLSQRLPDILVLLVFILI